jgi:hypothetical protein
MDMSTIIYPLVIVLIIIMGVKMASDMFGKKKKPKMIEIPRDTSERLEKAYKAAIKGKLNKEGGRYTIWTSGDELIRGGRVGDVTAKQLQNEEYILYIKRYWWMFWKKAIPVHVDVQLCTDWNAKNVVVECRGWESTTEGLVHPIPQYGTKNLEAIYGQRACTKEVRYLKQFISDMDTDLDISPKIALRGAVEPAHSEVGRFEEMPTIEQEEIRRKQQSMLRQRYGAGEPGQGGG